ncbi:FMN-dependent NADH-azoreductase [Pseudonocardia sp. HH130630-07]|uniref:FMN-dependent NADH-azoreductase n=1 Tax=Pseudonocardia sp. HH130630-07 TaxID=1690815 RepID=UPI00081533E9|nr:NAD(P)H-dependent oxidoreductase [Pseudonocardia sp. HH130630-07]ANY06852.1 ACP phosphodiesterase [Pseudonocardia sp. HH130630-07]
MTLLRIDASIQGPRSAGSELADLVLAEVTANRPEEPVVRRHLGEQPLPAEAWARAIAGGFATGADRSPEQAAAIGLARTLAAELSDADAAVLAFPLYNFGVSQHVKAWIDLVFAGAEQGARLLEGKPVVLVVTRGGAYGPGTPREGWDHCTDFLRRILVDLWGADLTVVEREFTLAGVNPALAEFAELGASLKADAEQAASRAGKALASR